MSTPSRRRLMRDFKKLQSDPPAGVSAAPTEDNIMVWEAVIFGPQDTPFEDGTFRLSVEFSEEYPNKPPIVKFISKMFHPNVYADGSICLDILQNQWSPTYDVAAILTSIQSLLDEPNPNSPANSVAAQLYQENRREYDRRVQAIVEQSWMAFKDDQEEREAAAAAALPTSLTPSSSKSLSSSSAAPASAPSEIMSVNYLGTSSTAILTGGSNSTPAYSSSSNASFRTTVEGPELSEVGTGPTTTATLPSLSDLLCSSDEDGDTD